MKTTIRILKYFLLPAALGFSPMTLAQSGPVLETPQGTLIGSRSETDGSVRVFRGIPYAAPPTGAARWRPPRPAPRWQGERLATQFAPDCMQLPYPQNSFFYRPARPKSEDCLYLNVWTAADSGEQLPVMVWIHGGALTRGSGAIGTYDGSNLAGKDVVVVTLNYRLGVFGYFAHPELVAESEDFTAGNYGILDQIQALRWVQDHIEAFGGDPDNVTIFGESAGAWSVNFLTASPLAEGLFHKAIAQSGARLDKRRELDRENSAGPSAVSSGSQLAGAIGADSLQALRDMPACELLVAAEEAGFSTDGIVDGRVIPEQPYEIFADGRQNEVPVLLGFNKDEGTTLGAGASAPDSPEAYRERIRARYGNFAGQFLEVYPADTPRESTLASYRDSAFGWNMVTWANLTRQVDQPAYLYYFAHHPPGPRSDQLGAYHASEIAYVFDNPHTLRGEPGRPDRRLADAMSDYWVSFARDGEPRAGDQPQWRPYSNSERHYLRLDVMITAENGLMPEHWALWDRIMDSRR